MMNYRLIIATHYRILSPRLSLPFSAQYLIPDAAELVDQPPAPRGPYAPQLVREDPVLLLVPLLGPRQPATEFLDPLLVLPSELLDPSLILLSELLGLRLVLLSELLEVPLKPQGLQTLYLGLCLCK